MRENRQHQRSTAVIKVNYNSHGALQMDYAQNISRGGLFLATNSPFELGQAIELHLNTQGLERAIAVPGVVRWIGERGVPKVKGIGIQFTLEDPKVKSHIEEMVSALDEPKTLDQPPADPSEGQRSSATQVFILDPNDFASKMYADGISQMAQRGHRDLGAVEVTRFTHPDDLVSTLNERPCDVLITELQTEELDGVQLIRALRAQRGERFPIFAISRPFPNDRERALEAGATAFLNKPLQMRTLFNTLLICLKERSKS